MINDKNIIDFTSIVMLIIMLIITGVSIYKYYIVVRKKRLAMEEAIHELNVYKKYTDIFRVFFEDKNNIKKYSTHLDAYFDRESYPIDTTDIALEEYSEYFKKRTEALITEFSDIIPEFKEITRNKLINTILE